MNFAITWLFDKLGYMPKINFEVGKVDLQTAWPFPVESEKPKKQVKKAVVRKTVAKKTVAKKTTKKAK
jgi:hypothetical protein